MTEYGLVCNEGFKRILANSHQFEIFDSSADLDKYERLLSDLKGIVVLAETRWQNLYFGEFKGLNIVRDFRLKYQLDVPILVISFLVDLNLVEEINLIANKQAPFNLLLDPSIDITSVSLFLEACRSNSLFQLFPKPIRDEILFEDVMKLHNPKEYLNELAHALRRKVNDFSEIAQGGKILHFINQIFREIKMIAPEQQWKIAQILDAWKTEIQEDSEYHFFKEFAKRLRDEVDDINHEMGLNSNAEHEVSPLTILSVDDDQVDQQKLAGQLKKQYGIECIAVKNINEAKDQLARHQNIEVIVIDYRYYDHSKRFSRTQCHHIIDELSSFKNELLSFILLTNYPESLNPLFLKLYAGLPRFSKKILDDELLFLRFVQKIEEAAKSIEEIKAKAFGLHPLFHKYYLAYRNHKFYSNYEEKVNHITNDYLEKVANSAYEKLPILAIQTKLTPSNNSYNLEMFITKLIGRRVIISLLQMDKFWITNNKGKKPKWGSILNLLIYQRWLKDGEKEMKQNQQNQIINNNLGLKRKMNCNADTPIHEMKILEEEKLWLEQFRKLQ